MYGITRPHILSAQELTSWPGPSYCLHGVSAPHRTRSKSNKLPSASGTCARPISSPAMAAKNSFVCSVKASPTLRCCFLAGFRHHKGKFGSQDPKGVFCDSETAQTLLL